MHPPGMHAVTLHEECLTLTSFSNPKHINVDCAERVKKLYIIDPQLQEIVPNCITNYVQTLTNLTHLNFRGNLLESVPSEIGILVQLEYLEFSHSKLAGIPEEIGKLINLKTLNVSNNVIDELPVKVFDLEKLLYLNVSGNNIQHLPDAIGKLTHLCNLDVSNNMLMDLPETLAQLDNLKTVNASSNQIQGNLPSCFFMGLKNILTLDLSHNMLDNLRALPLCAPLLRNLNLSHNQMMLVPEWMCVACGCLEDLDLSHNSQMTGTAEDPNDLYVHGGGIRHTLKRLNVSGCKMTSKSTDFLGSFKNLVELRAGNPHRRDVYKPTRCETDGDYGNMFWDIPSAIMVHASYLTVLCLPAVRLSVLPKNVSDLKALQVLDLCSNELHYLNDELCQLTSLTKVMLSDNCLQTLPNNIGALNKLEELHVDKNQIHVLPKSFSLLKHLAYIDLYDNCLEELVPDCILNSAILKGLDVEQNNVQSIDVISCTPYEELKSKMRSWDAFAASRVDGSKNAIDLQEDCIDEDEDDNDSLRSYGSSASLHSEKGYVSDHHCEEDPHVYVSPSDSNWDSPIEDESDWMPTECVYVNVPSKIKKGYPPPILSKRTFVKPNLVWQEGQFDTD